MSANKPHDPRVVTLLANTEAAARLELVKERIEKMNRVEFPSYLALLDMLAFQVADDEKLAASVDALQVYAVKLWDECEAILR